MGTSRERGPFARRFFRLSRRGLDGWFGTVVRYSGLGLFVYALAIDQLRNPALLPAATAMMFLKNVAGAGD